MQWWKRKYPLFSHHCIFYCLTFTCIRNWRWMLVIQNMSCKFKTVCFYLKDILIQDEAKNLSTCKSRRYVKIVFLLGLKTSPWKFKIWPTGHHDYQCFTLWLVGHLGCVSGHNSLNNGVCKGVMFFALFTSHTTLWSHLAFAYVHLWVNICQKLRQF